MHHLHLSHIYIYLTGIASVTGTGNGTAGASPHPKRKVTPVANLKNLLRPSTLQEGEEEGGSWEDDGMNSKGFISNRGSLPKGEY